MNPRSLANLNPAKPGEVRNPLGINGRRPVLSEALRQHMTPRRAKRLIAKAWAQAEAGDPRMLALIWERAEGRVPLPVQGELVVRQVVIVDDDDWRSAEPIDVEPSEPPTLPPPADR